MLGAVSGDVIGSSYEFSPIEEEDFPLFTKDSHLTDDTVCTCAIAEAILTGGPIIDYKTATLKWCQRYPDAGYGSYFAQWIFSKDPQPYESFGNGSAMRVSPVAYAFDTLEQVLEEAKKSAEFTHNHPEGIKGAQATAAAIFMARQGGTKESIKEYITTQFGYNLSRSLDEVIATHKWNATCQKTVPESIIAFLESTDFESAIRNAIKIKGDADTMAAIAGSIAYAFYPEINQDLIKQVIEHLDEDVLKITAEFYQKYIPNK